MSQINLPIRLPLALRNTSAGKVHQKTMSIARELTASSKETIDELKLADRTEPFGGDFTSWNDLSPKKGVVTMVRDDQSESIQSARLSFDPESGAVESFVSEAKDGKLRRQSDSELKPGEQPTYSWETGTDSNTNHTLLRFNEELGTISILDQSDNLSPLLGVLSKSESQELQKLSVPGGAPLPWM